MGCEKEQKKKPQGSHSAREDTVTFLCHMYFEMATLNFYKYRLQQ